LHMEAIVVDVTVDAGGVVVTMTVNAGIVVDVVVVRVVPIAVIVVAVSRVTDGRVNPVLGELYPPPDGGDTERVLHLE